MIVSFNHQQILVKDFHVSLDDRAFRYGDGLFETLIYNGSEIRFFSDHIKRLKEGMKSLGFVGVNGLKKDLLNHQIGQLLKKNNLTNSEARIKINIWRKGNGLYFPENNQFNILISTNQIKTKKNNLPIHISFSKNSKVHFSGFSAFKSNNSLPYIIAGQECSKRNLDDLILLNLKNKIAECISSNIFWVKNNTVFTPKVKTGCVAGIARKNIIKKLTNRGILVKKVIANKTEILDAEFIFTSNVSGLKIVSRVDDKKFNTDHPIQKHLNIY
ncbi:aminotransferase class IV [Flexithrix dorotheae]|uniref:aminotransferase class IV n=1 Tax=Flexithrix dorotheae TaxID=70993 RepID=UPI0003716193|nr:aminotransferase class IV [Flexithrix dorotheae]